MIDWVADFEEGDEREITANDGGFLNVRGIQGVSITFVHEAPFPFSGLYSLKAYTPPRDPNQLRLVVRSSRGARWSESRVKKDGWYGGAVYFPQTFYRTNANDWCSFISFRVHNSATFSDSQYMTLSAYPNRALRLRRSWKGKTEFYYPSVTIGDGWNKWVVHLITGNPGIFELWWNGIKVYEKVGDFDAGTSANRPGPIFQFGLYRGNLEPQELWVGHDAFKIGDSYGEVEPKDDVTPPLECPEGFHRNEAGDCVPDVIKMGGCLATFFLDIDGVKFHAKLDKAISFTLTKADDEAIL